MFYTDIIAIEISDQEEIDDRRPLVFIGAGFRSECVKMMLRVGVIESMIISPILQLAPGRS